ncbi:MAG: PBP1A family penicillin-binding protein [Candidatus Moranbacteria bacterium]|nr:PBP1A family penicillin-binding protein [Candidatus Moranbacteria bacterium]
MENFTTTPASQGKHPKRNIWKILWLSFLALAIGSLIFTAGFFIYFAKDLPSPGKVNSRFIAESTKIYDRTGEHLLYEVHGEEKRTLIPYEEMPEVIRTATITLEDQEFYSHHGIKFTSIVRAVLADVLHRGAKQGGSTITQQFVKNSLLSPEKTLTRKIKEVILSLEMETKFSKDEILAMYLNEIPYGSNAYGIEAASETFFGKHARELGLDESTLLASLPNAPSYYSPYGSHADALKARQEFALQKMANAGYITQEQADEAKQTDVLAKLKPQSEKIQAPHFVMYIKEYLESKYGDQTIEQDGLKVYTTLDWDKQVIAEQVISDGAAKNEKYKANNASLVSVDPKTGQVLAMVGSKNYWDKSIDGQVNVSIRDRQPGSSFKPYVYLTAFTKGYLPETMIYDTPTNFSTDDGKEYAPNNYDGKFHGPLSLAKALGGSLNIPAVKTLYLVGVKDALTLAKSLGITSLNQPDRYGLSLVLGGGEVKLLDHVSAYATLATGGVKHPQTAILKIEDSKGNVLEEYHDNPGERVVEEKYVAMLDSILSNNENRAWIFGENNPFRSDTRPMAAKTGTTNGFHDAWAIGYTPSLSTGVWVGNSKNEEMSTGADGSVVAAPIWRAFMDKALANSAIEEFPKYNSEDEIGDGDGKTNKLMLAGKLDEAKDLKVCQVPGKEDKYCIANKYCPDKEADKKTFISGHDILYYVNTSDPRGDTPEKPDRDSQYKQWEKGVKKWYEDKENAKHTIVGDVPTEECKEGDFTKFLPSISLSAPSDATTTSVSFSASVDAPLGIKDVTFSVDGNGIGSSSSDHPSVSYSIPAEKNNSTLNVEVKVTDDNGNTKSDSKSVSVHF